MRFSFLPAALAAIALANPAVAGSRSVLGIGTGQTAGELLSPCQESDNDARWGQAAEIECEQYLIGFVEALSITGQLGEGTEICPPEQNTADEVRWAFMRWVHGDYGDRTKMPASEAVMATLREAFPCN